MEEYFFGNSWRSHFSLTITPALTITMMGKAINASETSPTNNG